MKACIINGNTEYIINLEPITQLCGISFNKKNFIINSLYKYYSGSKYEYYEINMQENIKINGEKTGRKYFNTFKTSSREQLIKSVKISKSSIMMQYISTKYTSFNCQKIIDKISENLEKLYLEINQALQNSIGYIEVVHHTKNIMEIIQNSDISGTEEKALENLSNIDLLLIYINLLWEMQKIYPDKTLIIIENIDHLISYKEYQLFVEKIEQFSKNHDVWFILSTSIEGYAILNQNTIEGINIINDCIFSFPDIEHLITFIQKRYPIEIPLNNEEDCENIRMVIQNIGCENYNYYFKGSIILKILQNSLYIPVTYKNYIDSIEKAFLMDKNMI